MDQTETQRLATQDYMGAGPTWHIRVVLKCGAHPRLWSNSKSLRPYAPVVSSRDCYITWSTPDTEEPQENRRSVDFILRAHHSDLFVVISATTLGICIRAAFLYLRVYFLLMDAESRRVDIILPEHYSLVTALIQRRRKKRRKWRREKKGEMNGFLCAFVALWVSVTSALNLVWHPLFLNVTLVRLEHLFLFSFCRLCAAGARSTAVNLLLFVRVYVQVF